MVTDQVTIGKLRAQIESRLGWGNSDDWTNHDFVALSDKIRERTGVALSHVTLKRIWGKVKYESLPNVHTLTTLARFIDYGDWREFKLQNGFINAKDQTPARNRLLGTVSAAILVTALISIIALVPGRTEKATQHPLPVDPADYSFSTKKIISAGLPNSVIFDYNAAKAPEDSVIIQQSWDRTLRDKVPRGGRQHTCIYYYPDYFYAKLIVGDRIVKQQPLFIQSDGWMAMVERPHVPVYLRKEETVGGGKMNVPVKLLNARNISLQPDPPTVLFTNVRDFGEIYSDDFVFETSLRNDYAEGSSICQVTRVYLLCEGTAIWIPLSAKGCISDLDMLFTRYYTSGRQEDLSAFGVDFHHFVRLRIESHGGHANVLINDKLAYRIDRSIQHSKIIGIDYRFQGTGSVDYVRLSNEVVHYDEEF
ncbi:MAG: hypothetical protein Q8927_19775 [Bacteroidota bacterium]|nr:hypothetical protein [Bacteroidota bacterium]